MATRVKSARVKGSKVEVVYRQSVSQRIGRKKKAERLEKAWRAKSK